MDFLLWVMSGIILIGFIVVISMKKRMETKLAHLQANPESAETSKDAKHMVWWIWSATAWGVISMALVVWWFNYYTG